MQISNSFQQSFNDAYARLNSKQREAVDTIEGPVLVVAGPGTGKTQILAVRIGKILEQTDVFPENILCLTYTDAGTIAMRKRLSDFIGPDAYRVNIYTFHAFCNDVIRANLDYFGKRELEPITELENVNLLESIYNELPPGHLLKKYKGDLSREVPRLNNLFRMMKEEDWDEKKVSAAIDAYLDDLPTREKYIYKRANTKTGVKVGDIKWNDINEVKERMEKTRAAANLFPKYVQRMRDAGRYDYSDMILWVAKAFRDPSPQGENMLRNYQERYLYFLVDEYQDTNGAQNEILNLLTGYWDTPNVFAVGDDDQSIYEFQGARVKNILDFYEAYANHIKVVVLDENYRSHQWILDASKGVIEKNAERLINKLDGLTKDLIASNKDRRQPIAPRVMEYENTAQEAAGIMQQIEALHKNGIALNEVAVIFFQHAQAETLISVCEKRGVPYQVRKKINILDLPLVNQCINMLRYLEEESQNAHSSEYLLFEIMHYPWFQIHPHDIAMLSAWIAARKDEAVTWRTTLSDPATLSAIKLKDHESIIRFEKKITHWLQEVYNLTLQILFEKVLNESGLLQYLLTGPDRVWNLEVISTFFDHIKAEGIRNPRVNIHSYLETLSQMETHHLRMEINKSINNTEGVNFITCHSAKGLEFEYVFLMGCTGDKWEKRAGGNYGFGLPDTLTFSTEENKIESMRRLFYVAMTRAKQNLQVSYSRANSDGKETDRSQFVAELLDGGKLQAETVKVPQEVLVEFKISELSETKPVIIELFDRDFIKKRVEHFVMSASALNTYLDCPVKYYFERIVKVPGAKSDSMAFGTAIHYALRRLFERMKESERQQFPTLQIFIQDFEYDLKRNEDSFTEKQYDNRLELGRQLLTDYYDHYIHSFNKVVVTEYPVRNVMLKHVPITGVFDKIEFINKEVNVVDYKTGNVTYAKDKLKAPDEKNPLGGDYWRQILFYKILMDAQKYKPWKMVSGEIDFIEKNEKGEFVKHQIVINEGEIEVVKQQIMDVYDRIQRLEFTTGCNKEDCEWCAFVKTVQNR